MYFTKVTPIGHKLRRQACPSPLWEGGAVVECGARGVWVPDGLDAADILTGASALQTQFGADAYTARSMTRAVLLAVRART